MTHFAETEHNKRSAALAPLPDRRVIYVVAKAPRKGQSKTRLCPPLTSDQAAQLAAAFLEDTISLARSAGVDVRLICPDEAERDALRPYAASGVTVHVQDGVGLGAALECAFVTGTRDGYDAVGVLGMDTPSLPARVISGSFEALAEAEVALGQSVDGGYYLLTARCAVPELFRDMVWSTKEVAAETLRRCASLGLRVREMTRWDDVDDWDSLQRLRELLAEADPSVAARSRVALRGIVTAVEPGAEQAEVAR